MLLGSHLSIAGGMHNALLEAESLGLDTVQVFTKNQQQWQVKPLAEDAVCAWTTHLDRLGWQGRTVSHASYLINLASPKDDLWDKSIGLMQVELERCAQLSIPYLVHHPGAFTTSDEASGLTRIAKAYKELFKRTKGVSVVSCLENTVGSGSNLGREFGQLAQLRTMIIDETGEPERVGFCIDTCHAHAGGYDLSTRALAEDALAELDRTCGLANVNVLHLNDSLKEMGSRKDRHAHIGEGTITNPPGRKQPLKDSGFTAFVSCPAFEGIPMILETPKGEDDKGRPLDKMNMRRVRGLLR